MRISVTDRCNLRCKYCMPEEVENIPMDKILTYEEIVKVARAAVGLGICHLRLTGGEPLVRKDVEQLVKMLRKIPGVQSLWMTTNGVYLADAAQNLKQAGLDGVNVSLDTVNREQFRAVTGADVLDAVIRGIDCAKQAGLEVKINVVHRKETEVIPLIEFAEAKCCPIRFIEMMPIGYGKKYQSEDNGQLLELIEKQFGKSEPIIGPRGNGPARYFQFEHLATKVGFISAIHKKFCKTCNRVRLTSEGDLKLCLCYGKGIKLRKMLRDGCSEEVLAEAMREAIYEKPLEHHFLEEKQITEEREMNRIGG